MINFVAILALLGSAYAVPVLETAPHCDGYYLVEKWNTTVRQPAAPAGFGTFKGCAPSPYLQKRQDAQYDTTIELNDDSWDSVWVTGETAPQDLLWDRAVAELCGNIYCDGQLSISEPSGRPEEDLVLSIDGQFLDAAMRDNFINLVREAFYASQQSEEFGEGLLNQAYGSAFYNANSGKGEFSGYFIQVRWQNVAHQLGIACPDSVTRVLDFFSNAPADIGSIFGIVGAICQ